MRYGRLGFSTPGLNALVLLQTRSSTLGVQLVKTLALMSLGLSQRTSGLTVPLDVQAERPTSVRARSIVKRIMVRFPSTAAREANIYMEAEPLWPAYTGKLDPKWGRRKPARKA